MLDGHDLPHLEHDRGPAGRARPGAARPAEHWEEFLALGELRRGRPPTWPPGAAPLTPDDIADLLFTSGTTGKPKGVICTHAQTLRTVATWANVVGLARTDRYLAVNPFFHSFGYKAGIDRLARHRLHLLPVPVFDVPEVMQLIAAERITVLPGPPTLYQTILNHPDLAEARLVVPAPRGHRRLDGPGEPDRADARRPRLRHRDHRLRPHRGVRVRHHLSPDDDAATIATSRRAMPGIEVCIVDPTTGDELPRRRARRDPCGATT
jgi:hypothetical protein